MASDPSRGDPTGGDPTGDERTLVRETRGGARPDPGTAPELVGPYRLLERLGEGGMGEVWLAQQLRPVERKVALKLVKAGMDTREVVRRFESERQALALMDHPAIAKVLDAGSTDEGRPYFVMEYVPGGPITEFCDAAKLSTGERLSLLVQVCDGVQHAHQKAILHRDLKPSNVLVVRADGGARPRIIDFGVAKALGEHGPAAPTMHTVAGMLLGTLEYMSPEQAGAPGPDLDTRADVYSLGVMLYQLLTGSLPFPSRELRLLSLAEIVRVIREVDPPRPSTRASTLGEAAAEVARNRQTEPGILPRILRGDLDAITLKAMEKDRSRRYGSASDLAADVGRYLRHEPVLARTPSTAYRAAKYVRRHRVGVAVAATLVTLLAAFAGTTAAQARRVARERDRANAEAQRATREAEAAERVSALLTSMFKVSDPGEARGNSITAREVLDRAAPEVEAALARQPELQARMMSTIGEVYENLGLYRKAHGLVEVALHTRLHVLGPEASATLESMRTLCRLLLAEGRPEEAEPLARRSLETARRVFGPEGSATLLSKSLLASVLSDRGDQASAEALARDVLQSMRRVMGPRHADTLASLRLLGQIESRKRRWAEAEALSRELLALSRDAVGPDAPDSLQALGNVAAMVSNQGRPAEAEPIIRELVERERRVLGPDHAVTLVSSENLATTLKFQRRFAEAEAIGRDVLGTRRRVLGPEHPDTLVSMGLLALIWKDQGRFAESERMARETLETRRRRLGPSHPETAASKYDLACILARAGKRDQALAALRDSVEHGLAPGIAASIASDGDFESLRGDRRFGALAEDGRRRAARGEVATPATP
jgi:non-specific serine/threonine protein kinase/serine/threonine-protein kinase